MSSSYQIEPEYLVLNNNPFLQETNIFATQTLVQKLSNEYVYHNLGLVQRVLLVIEEIGVAENLSEEEFEICFLTGMLFYLGLTSNFKPSKVTDGTDLFKNCKSYSIVIADKYLSYKNYPADKKAWVLYTMDLCFPDEEGRQNVVNDHLVAIVLDAIHSDWAKDKANKRLMTLYEELLLLDCLDVGKKGFYAIASKFLLKIKFGTNYGKTHFEPAKDELIRKIEKQAKSIQKSSDLALKKDLDISDNELKSLKKNLATIKGRDGKGIQTLFRNTVKSHYTINEMVDKKANIMISVNAIILSLLLSGVIKDIHIDNALEIIPRLMLTLTSVSSIIFAIVAIRPMAQHGYFTEEQIRNKEGNLLFYGNFQNMSLKDYEWGMYQMLNDSEYMYNTMIRDLYFLGQKLKRKNKYIRNSLAIFLVGLITTILTYFIIEVTF